MLAADLSGKRALVTGASRGVGRFLAEVLARAGAEVVMVARAWESLQKAADELSRLDGKVLPEAIDLSRSGRADEELKALVARRGSIDILVNNAGTAIRGSLLDCDLRAWRAVMALNVDACLITSRACVPGMIDRGWGRVINVGSPYGRVPSPGLGAYCVSKAALDMLTKAMALEWAGTGITANAIAPIQIRTALTEATYLDDERRAMTESQIPLGRWAQPEELAGALLLLSDEASGMMTGQTLYIDGGRLLV